LTNLANSFWKKLPNFLYHKLRGKKNHGIRSRGGEKKLQKHFPKRRIERLWRAQNDYFIIYYGTLAVSTHVC
jgi:hypothetical protein